jgi:hypothetical protein
VTTIKAWKAAANTALAVAVGVGLGFCCLEGIGAPLLIATLVIGRYAGNHSSADLAIPSLGFGLGFTACVAFFAARTSGIFNGTGGSGSVYWFGFWFLVGCGITSVGVISLMRRLASGTAPEGRPSAG